jgi:hypothetical protein
MRLSASGWRIAARLRRIRGRANGQDNSLHSSYFCTSAPAIFSEMQPSTALT